MSTQDRPERAKQEYEYLKATYFNEIAELRVRADVIRRRLEQLERAKQKHESLKATYLNEMDELRFEAGVIRRRLELLEYLLIRIDLPAQGGGLPARESSHYPLGQVLRSLGDEARRIHGFVGEAIGTYTLEELIERRVSDDAIFRVLSNAQVSNSAAANEVEPDKTPSPVVHDMQNLGDAVLGRVDRVNTPVEMQIDHDSSSLVGCALSEDSGAASDSSEAAL